MKIDLVSVPGSAGRIRVNASVGRAVASVISLTDASALPRRSALAAGAMALRVGGTRVLAPSKLPDWIGLHPFEFVQRLRSVVPRFQLYGLIVPRQPRREHLIVVGRAFGDLVAFKMDANRESITHEVTVLDMLTRHRIPSIITPRVLESGELALGTTKVGAMVTAVVGGRSRPVWRGPLMFFERQLAERLGTLDRPPGTPAHWTPAHGDLTPWNLRLTSCGLALFDWESARYAPPGTDLTYYATCSAAMSRGPWPALEPEVGEYLIRMIDERHSTSGSRDHTIRAHLSEQLQHPQEGLGRASDP